MASAMVMTARFVEIGSSRRPRITLQNIGAEDRIGHAGIVRMDRCRRHQGRHQQSQSD